MNILSFPFNRQGSVLGINISDINFNIYFDFKIDIYRLDYINIYFMNNSFQLILNKNEREINNQWTNIMIYSKYFLRIYNPIFTYFLRQFFLFVQTENVLNFT